MTIKEAYKILHKDTTRQEILRIKMEDGWEAALEKVVEACEVACECMEKQIQNKPDDVFVLPGMDWD